MAPKTKHILLPVDLNTETTSKLVAWALENCQGEGFVVHVMHVEPIALRDTGSRAPTEYYPMIVEKEHKPDCPVHNFLKENVLDKLEAAGIKAKLTVVRFQTDNSSIGEAVCEIADEIKADQVVLLKHQQGVLAKIFLGSVCTYVSHHCRRPVTLLH